jgi:hypothetical protein
LFVLNSHLKNDCVPLHEQIDKCTFESPALADMDTASLRQKLHDRIERADRTELLSLLKIVEDDGGRSSIPEEFLPELERRLADLKSGRTKTVSAEESKTRLDKMLADAKGR